LTHTFLVLVIVGLCHGVYGKWYKLIAGQRAEKFENHCTRPTALLLAAKRKARWNKARIS